MVMSTDPEIGDFHCGYIPAMYSQIFSTLLENDIALKARVFDVRKEPKLECDINISLA